MGKKVIVRATEAVVLIFWKKCYDENEDIFFDRDFIKGKKMAAYSKEYYLANIESIEASKERYAERNKKKISKRKAKYYKENKKHIIERVKEYNQENKDRIKRYKAEYYQKNKEEIERKRKARIAAEKGKTRAEVLAERKRKNK